MFYAVAQKITGIFRKIKKTNEQRDARTASISRIALLDRIAEKRSPSASRKIARTSAGSRA